MRSSGIAEDLEGASFAGQYETVLDVEGRSEIERAVLQCWSSALATRVALYRDRPGQVNAALAVLVQRMVRAGAAGVAQMEPTGRSSRAIMSPRRTAHLQR